MSNPSDRLQQSVPLINPADSSSPTTATTSTVSIPTSVATNNTNNNPGRVSQFVSNVNLSNLIQSNSFLHSDFGNFVEIPQNNPMPNNNGNNSLTRASSVQSSTENQNNNQTVVDLQGIDNESPETPGIDPSDQTAPGGQAGSVVSFLISSLQSSFPFFLLLLAKIFHQHLIGFFIVLAFMTTLHWSNRTLVHQVELRDKKQNKRLALLILFLLLNTGIFFLIFKDYELYKCLVFLAPNVKTMDTWNLIWIVVCSDTIIKYMTISMKAIITLLPFKVMPLRKRGGYYSLIETITQLYRSLTPIHPWFLYLFYAEQKEPILPTETTEATINRESTFMLVFLCILYTICKLNQLYGIGREVWASVRDMKSGLSSVRTRLSVSSENEENMCPICQDKLNSPVKLKCQHVFCEDCVCVWLDKENSCPMCRAKIAVKKPQYKDGSTTIFIQWY